MPPIAIRPFRRSDRDQLTDLVNAHVEAVLPGVTVPPNAVLSQLEREPGEPLVDPWVTHRHTLVARWPPGSSSGPGDRMTARDGAPWAGEPGLPPRAGQR